MNSKVKEYLIENWGAVEVNGIETDDACLITKKYYEEKWKNL